MGDEMGGVVWSGTTGDQGATFCVVCCVWSVGNHAFGGGVVREKPACSRSPPAATLASLASLARGDVRSRWIDAGSVGPLGAAVERLGHWVDLQLVLHRGSTEIQSTRRQADDRRIGQMQAVSASAQRRPTVLHKKRGRDGDWESANNRAAE